MRAWSASSLANVVAGAGLPVTERDADDDAGTPDGVVVGGQAVEVIVVGGAAAVVAVAALEVDLRPELVAVVLDDDVLAFERGLGAHVVGAFCQRSADALGGVQRDGLGDRKICGNERHAAEFSDLLGDESFERVLGVFDRLGGGDDGLFVLGDAGFGLNHIERRLRADLGAFAGLGQQLFRFVERLHFRAVVFNGENPFVVRGADGGDFVHDQLDEVLLRDGWFLRAMRMLAELMPRPKFFRIGCEMLALAWPCKGNY